MCYNFDLETTYMNYPTKVKRCPICKQGWVQIVKEISSGQIYLCCSECDAEWADPSTINENNCLQFNTYGEYIVVSPDEIKAKSWGKYVLEEFLKRIHNGDDGLIRKVEINNMKEAIIIVSVMDFENSQSWINVKFTANNLKEFKIVQKQNFSNVVLSSGIKFKEIDGFCFLDFDPYSDEIDTVDDFRRSEVYVCCDEICFDILPYSE